MAGRLNPHFMLLEKHCELLREANRILAREAPRPHISRAAAATIAAIEPVALDLIDEEYARVPRAQEVVYSSGSIALARKASAVAGLTPVLTERTWRIALVNGGVDQIEGLIAGPVQVAGLALPLLERLREGDAFYGPLLTRVAELDRDVLLQDGKSDWIFDCTPVPEATADFLRRQVRAFPDKYESTASDLARSGDWKLLSLLFMAGAAMPDPDTALRLEAEVFLRMVHSNHGKLDVMQTLGSLEEALATSRTTSRLKSKLSSAIMAS